MRALIPSILFLGVAFAGCFEPPGGPGVPTDEVEPEELILAPWWQVGRWWDVSIKHGTQPALNMKLVNFWNRTEEHHFYIGITDRDGGCPSTTCGGKGSALDHALHDNNPLLGRIHWELLTPHEAGDHAQAMFLFPVEIGKEFGGNFFGREWTNIVVSAGKRMGTVEFKGTSAEGATIHYDYDPVVEWFTFIEIKENGGVVERIDVKNHGVGAKGTYWFLRGRDYYLGVNQAGTKDDPFQVPAISGDAKPQKLAVEINGQATGVLKIQLKDPQGTVRYEKDLLQNSMHNVDEIPNPPEGKWTMSYVGAGSFAGTVEVVGILEYTKTL